MKKIFVGLLLALTATALSQAQTGPRPRRPMFMLNQQTNDLVADTLSWDGSQTQYPIPDHNPWPWEYELPHQYLRQ